MELIFFSLDIPIYSYVRIVIVVSGQECQSSMYQCGMEHTGRGSAAASQEEQSQGLLTKLCFTSFAFTPVRFGFCLTNGSV